MTAKTDTVFRVITALAAGVILVLMLGILLELWRLSLPAMAEFGLGFLSSSRWNPATGKFGAAASIYGTLVSTAIAMIIAAPLAVVIALFLVELAPPRLARVVGTAIELLAGIPSIIYGMWGLFVFAPILAEHVQPRLGSALGWLPLFQGPPIGIGMLTAGLILALMVLPYLAAVMRDVFKMVPPVLKESAYGMGSTTWEVTAKVTVRYGLQGLIGACFLGLGRAVGETMAVTFVIGNSHNISAGLFNPGTSIASTLANEFAEASEPIYLSALVELGLILLLVTLLINAVAQLWLQRVKRKMGTGL